MSGPERAEPEDTERSTEAIPAPDAPRSPLRGLAATAIAALFALSGISLVLLRAVETVRATGAVVRQEFAFGAFLFAHEGHLLWFARAGVGLSLVLVVWRERDLAWRRLLAILAAAAGVGAFLDTRWLFASIALVAVLDLAAAPKGFREASGVDAFVRALTPSSGRAAVRAFGALALRVLVLGSVSAILVSLTEIVFFTRDFATYFDPADLPACAWLLASCSVAHRFFDWVGGLVFLALAALLAWGLARWTRPLALTFLLAVVSIATVVPLVLQLLYLFEGEIRELHLTNHAYLCGLLVGYLFFTLFSSNICLVAALSEAERGAASVFRLTTAYALVPILPLAHLLVRIGVVRRWIPLSALSCAGLLVAIYLLTFPLYPELVDYSSQAEDLFAALVTALVFVWLVQATSIVAPRTGGRTVLLVPAGLAIAALSALGISRHHDDPDLRFIAIQYTRINHYTSEEVFDRLEGENRLGFSPPEDAGAGFRFHGEKHSRLPELPRHLEAPRGRPIVIFLADAGRADRMSVYGYERDTTPQMREFAKDAVLCRRHYTAGTATAVSLRSLFSGCYSSRFMLEQERVAPFITQELPGLGVRDFFVNILGTDYNGISIEAFERYLPRESRGIARYHAFPTYDESDKVDEALRMLEPFVSEHRARGEEVPGFLLFVHCTATHSPWRFNADSPDWGDDSGGLYDNCMAHIDRAFGKLLGGLVRLGLYDDAIIAFTADHGTGLGDHGVYSGFFPYEEQIRIPLILKIPGVSPGEIDIPTSSVDLAPTIVNVFQGGVPNRFHGVSLLPLLEGTDTEIDREQIFSLAAFQDAYAVVDRSGYKLHYYRRNNYWQLYDLRADPRELRTVTRARPDILDRLTRRLESFLWQGRGFYANPFHYKPWPE